MPDGATHETHGVIAEASDALVATLSARLDALLASWQLAMDAKRKEPVTVGNAPPRPPAEVLAELERELADLERRCAEQRQAAGNESEQAADWERRAMSAVQNGRDDLAREALNHHHNHLDAATQLAAEVTELEAVRDSYRNAVTAVRATTA